MSLRVQDLLVNDESGTLGKLTLSQVVHFVTLVSRLKDDILLTQPAHVSALQPPDVLPPSITSFLGNCCDLSDSSVDHCWDVLKDMAWQGTDVFKDRSEMAFVEYGHTRGLTLHSLYPPQHTCTQPDCARTKKGLLLKKAESRQAVLYTFDKGVLPAYSIHLYCEACNVNYHHNFWVKDGQRTYYDGIPDILQVGEHQFVERRVVNLWINLMLVSWTSATNCVRLYNLSLSQDKVPPEGWAFGFTLTADHVWDAFVILSLLEDCQIRQEQFVVPHTGAQKDRFGDAIRARNIRFRLFSQPELRHHCRKCLRIYIDENGVAHKVWVVVIDGIRIGCPRCGIHVCHTPLASNRHRFCPKHATTHDNICAIVGCDSPVTSGSRVCADASHQEVEQIHRQRGQARFQLKERLNRAQVAHSDDAIAEERDLADLVDGEEEEEFNIDSAAQPETQPESVGGVPPINQRKKIRAQFGRKRTHTEQIIVCPCGIIVARETFYGVEGVGSVVEMIKRTFRNDIKPDHIFFDNNCTLAKMVKGDPFFRDVGLTVDVFHFKSKHSETDTFCQTHCNPAAYPELATENGDGWYFNSSIAEQTNSWLRGYHAICREMLIDKYNFFLDEMILRRNRVTRAKLEREGRWPEYWPSI